MVGAKLTSATAAGPSSENRDGVTCSAKDTSGPSDDLTGWTIPDPTFRRPEHFRPWWQWSLAFGKLLDEDVGLRFD